MVKTKKIQINAEYLTNQEGRGKKKKKKKPQVKNFMTPNKMKQALMERVALHQKAIKDNEKSKKEEQEAATNFAGDFSSPDRAYQNYHQRRSSLWYFERR